MFYSFRGGTETTEGAGTRPTALTRNDAITSTSPFAHLGVKKDATLPHKLTPL